MTKSQSLYKRFNIEVGFDGAEQQFRTKVRNIFHLRGFRRLEKEKNIPWSMCQETGTSYDFVGSTAEFFTDGIPFNHFLFNLQKLVEVFWAVRKKYKAAVVAPLLICEYIKDSPVDLGVRLVFHKDKPSQILPSKAKFLDEELVDDLLNLLSEDRRYTPVHDAFAEGLKEFMGANEGQKLKNVAEDMHAACDELAKVAFQDKNLGFKHFFKDSRWEKLGLSSSQKRIFDELRRMINNIKHGVTKQYSKDDIESIVYLTATFIKLVANKSLGSE